MRHRVATIGFGAIGATLVDNLSQDAAYTLAVLLRPGSPSAASVPEGIETLPNLASLLAWRPDLVVEAAGQGALRDYAAPCLAAGIPVVACSVGALADAALFEELSQAAARGKARLVLPSGAVASLDYVAAVAALQDATIVYESRKPPAAWQDVLSARGLDSASLAEPLILFAGPAREAARLFPQNLNVAATLALAGIGMERTQVRVVVDPAARGNTHVVTVSSAAGDLRTELVNRPSPANPKTSYVTGLSAVAAVRRFFASVVLG
jgi:aspartate dehydrogenase